MEKIKLEIPKKSEYISSVRLLTSSISNIKEFDLEEIENLKIIISEICLIFISNITKNEKPIVIEYNIYDEKIEYILTDENSGPFLEKEVNENSEMSILIIESLADSYKIDYDNKVISFIKNI